MLFNNIVAPSSAPVGFTVTAKTSTSIKASWRLPPVEDRNGVITGFKLFYKKKDSSVSLTMVLNDGSIQKKVVSELDVYTEYQFQVLAYTSVGDGQKSAEKYERTMEGGKKLITTLYVVQYQEADYVLCIISIYL